MPSDKLFVKWLVYYFLHPGRFQCPPPSKVAPGARSPLPLPPLGTPLKRKFILQTKLNVLNSDVVCLVSGLLAPLPEAFTGYTLNTYSVKGSKRSTV